MDRKEGARVKFPLQLAVAASVVTLCVGGLVLLGRSRDAEADQRTDGSPPVGAPDSSERVSEPLPAPLSGQKGIPSSARSLVPATAWLVADFQGDLVGQLPFSDQSGYCAQVPAPARVAVAVLPPAGKAEPEFMIAAPDVNDVFWGCARDRIIAAGGIPIAENDRYEVLKSPSGLVARGPEGRMVFLTSDSHLESALSSLSRLSEGSDLAGPHARMYARMRGQDDPEPTLGLTLVLPEGWLTQVGEEAKQTPLRHVHSAFMALRPDGSASGGVDCDEAGCPEVLAFLLRAKDDATGALAPDTVKGLAASLSAEHVVGTGRIALTFTPVGVDLAKLLRTLF